AAKDKRSAKHPEHPQWSSGSATAACGSLWAMRTAGRVTAKDRDSPDIAVTGIHCGDLHCSDPGGVGPSAGIGEDRSRSSPEADVENSSESRNATGWPDSNSADHFRCTTADANNPGSGDRRTDGGVPGFHPGILRLVCFDGPKRSEG